jgi:hypothetical protein
VPTLRNFALSAEFMKKPEPIIAPLEIMAVSKRPSFRNALFSRLMVSLI